MDNMYDIDFTKPLEIFLGGQWHDISALRVRNKPEPRFVWVNVYENSTPVHCRSSEIAARNGISYSLPFLHTLKINIDTGETEKVKL